MLPPVVVPRPFRGGGTEPPKQYTLILFKVELLKA